MNKMITVASGFQNAVNIAYDLNRDDKIQNFIPTQSSLRLLEEILLSTDDRSTQRARVLVGAYGRGKSHIILVILAMLLHKNRELFKHINSKLNSNERLKNLIENYYDSGKKILPILITGSYASLTQAFLQALQRTLSHLNLLDKMPETNYEAAVNMIRKWERDFPEVYKRFELLVGMPGKKFVDEINNFNVECYQKFEQVYPQLTAGNIFNPFLGFEIVDLYEKVQKMLESEGYSGLYVVYDEFSKYLEANIQTASVSDTKMLQDFAEMCNRSGKHQMHIMLISHKEIANYIDVLPKNKIDGWRGVSERFRHIHLNNNFTQTYEIIASVIQKDKTAFNLFINKSVIKKQFDALKRLYDKSPLLSDVSEYDKNCMIYGCYPLHPVSTFILPRLSERVAQNERTLFTFLSGNENNTLSRFSNNHDQNLFQEITPDLIYDYFEPLFKKEFNSQDLHSTYVLAASILSNLEQNTLESKIVKTIALIDILGQYDKIRPTTSELTSIFQFDYSTEKINEAISYLIEEKYVVYRNISNNYLRLKQTAGVDIEKQISDYIERHAKDISLKKVLQTSNIDTYIYPYRYNDKKEMTRFFQFEFIDKGEVSKGINWNIKSEDIFADGIIYGIILDDDDSLGEIKDLVLNSSKEFNRFIFVIPKQFYNIRPLALRFAAVMALRNEATNDKVLFDEYDVIYQDLQEVLHSFIRTYTHPEEFKANFIHSGNEITITRKAGLTKLMSDICDVEYSLTPQIINEALNKENPTSQAVNSRSKIVAGLLRNELEPSLGLSGTGQEVSIMRSTLIRTGVLINEPGNVAINLHPKDTLIENMLGCIINFITDVQQCGVLKFSELYHRLTSPEYHIGLRKGLIPIYLAAVFHHYKQELIISSNRVQSPLNSDTLLQINAAPEKFNLGFLDWNEEREAYIRTLADIFSSYVVPSEKTVSTYGYVVFAMKRWYFSLPKYSKDLKYTASGEKIRADYSGFTRILKQNISQHEFLFQKLPTNYGYQDNFLDGLAQCVRSTKLFYDNALTELKNDLILKVKQSFSLENDRSRVQELSLVTVIKDWCEHQNQDIFKQLFENGTEQCLKLFKEITNDEDTFIQKFARIATGLRVEDWNENTRKLFLERILSYKHTAENFTSRYKNNEQGDITGYQLTYNDKQGNTVTKRFDSVEISNRGKLLLNSIKGNIESMGYAISDQEKREILMKILKDMC